MRTMWIPGLLFSIVGTAAAQRPAIGTLDSLLENRAAQVHVVLFRGIQLSASQDSAARAVILESLVKREAILGTPSFREQAVTLVEARDTRLRGLLQTDAERTTFNANANIRAYWINGPVWYDPPQSHR